LDLPEISREDQSSASWLNSERMVGEDVLVVVAQVVAQVVHYSLFLLVVEVVGEHRLYYQKSWSFSSWS
jgi:hypothetical protein